MFALLPALGLASIITGKITAERDKKTCDLLLTTPLTGAEVLRAKTKASLLGFWQFAWPVPLVWLLGLLCGVVTPVLLLLAVIDLAFLTWLNIALGFTLSVKPRPTGVVSSRSSTLTLILFVLQLPLIAAALASPRELAVFSTWGWATRWGLTLGVLAIVVVTGIVAWHLTRRTLDKFEEWVGRPCVGREPTESPNSSERLASFQPIERLADQHGA
jgi:hypothetical protein